MIDVLCWCVSRTQFVAGLTTTFLPDKRPLATVGDDGRLVPVEGVAIDEIGSIVDVPAVFNAQGEMVTPAVMVEGHHVNLRAYGPMERMLTAGLPQTDANGNPLGLFERTHLLQLIPGLSFVPITEQGVPQGYQGPNGVRLFDPAVVKTPSRIFF